LAAGEDLQLLAEHVLDPDLERLAGRRDARQRLLAGAGRGLGGRAHDAPGDGVRARSGAQRMVSWPPSTFQLWPLTKDAWSLARNTATAATSAGSPVRCRGMLLRT